MRDGKSDSETAATELAERVKRIAELAKARVVILALTVAALRELL